MMKFLTRIIIAVIIGAVLLSVVYEGYLKYKGDDVSVGPMGIVFVYRQSFIEDTYIFSDLELSNGRRLNRLVTLNTSFFLIKAVFRLPVKDSVLIDINGDGKVELIATLKEEEDFLFKGIVPKDAVICDARNKLSPEQIAVCEAADEYYQNTVKSRNFKEKVDAIRGKKKFNYKKENPDKLNLSGYFI